MENFLEKINSLNPILASKSPRRKFLLNELGICFETIPSLEEEIYSDTLLKKEVPLYLAQLKGESISKQYTKRLVISADTIVLHSNKILGKPNNKNEATEMLQYLSGNKHEVITGVYLSYDDRDKIFSETTSVYFRKLSKEFIEYYINQYKPFDKAGAYGIQEIIGYIGIEKIEGCYYNVMGLPVSKLFLEVEELINRI